MNARKTFWSLPRQRRAGAALWLSLFAGIIVVAALDRSHISSLSCGDFPGFYAPAEILTQKGGKDLYDVALQQQIENSHWPECLKGRFFMSVYPPFTAYLLSPLTTFGPLIAGYVFRGLSVLLYLAAFVLLWQLRRYEPVSPTFVSAVLLLMAPVFYGILGGQIAAPSLFLYLSIISLLSEPGRSREFLAGVCAGLWLFKPQYGALALTFLFFSMKPWLVLGAALPISWYYFLGSRALGNYWIAEWLHSVSDFSAPNYLSNQAQQVSLPGFTQALLSYSELSPSAILKLSGSCVLVCIAIALLFSIAIVRARRSPETLKRRLMLLGPIITMLSPQTLFYDLTIAIAPVLYFVKLNSSRRISFLLLATAAVGVLTLERHKLPLPPLFFVNLACFALVFTRSLRRQML